MLFLNPSQLSLLSIDLPDIDSVSIDRLAHREIVEWSDSGPFAIFADIPEVKVEITITQRLEREFTLAGPKPGEQGTLEFIISPNASHAHRQKVSAQVVVRSIRNDLAAKPERIISLAALSPNGATDPITFSDA
ncbi:MAG: hypothetical protein KF691_01310 [Phycisphaeraceae bacterium]|nr:hypothetical protein [Phycisphaeraceae bacterium]